LYYFHKKLKNLTPKNPTKKKLFLVGFLGFLDEFFGWVFIANSANRTAEKGIIHRTHAQYNATFKKCLAENERRCATCTRQLAGEMRDLDAAAANSTNLRERSPSPDIVFIGASPGIAVSASDKPAANSGSVAKAGKRVAGRRRSVEESPAKARRVGDISASAKPAVEHGGKARRDSGTDTGAQLLFVLKRLHAFLLENQFGRYGTGRGVPRILPWGMHIFG
jgi:hypothetical protein